MPRALPRLVAVVAALLAPVVALAQESQKFDAKALEKQFAPLPVYAPKRAVEDDEVVVTRDDGRDLTQAAYVVKGDLKKVLAFFEQKLGQRPQRRGNPEIGTDVYVWVPRPRKGDTKVRKVSVWLADEPGRVQITLMVRAMTEDEVEDEAPAKKREEERPSGPAGQSVPAR